MEQENQIILRDGSLVPLSSWQKQHGVDPGNLSDHFSIAEYHIGRFQPFRYSELIIEFAELFRLKLGKPVTIGAGYRTEEYQKQLQKNPNLLAAKISPHCEGMAFDIDTKTWEQTKQYVEVMQEVADDFGFKVRLGYRQYWREKKQTFVHVDVCPMYFAPGAPYYEREHPVQWEKEITW